VPDKSSGVPTPCAAAHCAHRTGLADTTIQACRRAWAVELRLFLDRLMEQLETAGVAKVDILIAADPAHLGHPDGEAVGELLLLSLRQTLARCSRTRKFRLSGSGYSTSGQLLDTLSAQFVFGQLFNTLSPYWGRYR